MTPDELRALADALSVPHRELATVDVIRAAAYLRACADAQPVAVVPAKWTERHTSAQTWIEDADQAHDLRLYVSGIMESHDQRIAYAQEIARRLNAAPTAPQAEPKRPAFLDEIDRAKEHVASWPQWMKDATVSAAATLPVTEPKREPSCLWSRADDDTDVWETKCGHAFTIIDGTPTDNQMAFCCYCGRRVDEEIGGSDAE